MPQLSEMPPLSKRQAQLINSLGLDICSSARKPPTDDDATATGNGNGHGCDKGRVHDKGKGKGHGCDKGRGHDTGKGKGHGSSSDDNRLPWTYLDKDGESIGQHPMRGHGEWRNGRWFPPLQAFRLDSGHWQLESRSSSWSGERSDTSEESKPSTLAARRLDRDRIRMAAMAANAANDPT